MTVMSRLILQGKGLRVVFIDYDCDVAIMPPALYHACSVHVCMRLLQRHTLPETHMLLHMMS